MWNIRTKSPGAFEGESLVGIAKEMGEYYANNNLTPEHITCIESDSGRDCTTRTVAMHLEAIVWKAYEDELEEVSFSYERLTGHEHGVAIGRI